MWPAAVAQVLLDPLPECPPVPIAPEDVDTIRDVLHDAVRVWEYPQSASRQRE